MTLQEFYTRIGGNYDDTLRRIPSEALVRKFVLKYPNDPSFGQLKDALAYETASPGEKDYAAALAALPKISWQGHCMYCGHCAPCPSGISVAEVTKFLNLARAQGEMPETVREHYRALTHHGSECVRCGACEKRCPFAVPVRSRMNQAKKLFGR
mgnify:CR=1 FL=1